ncbi:MAG: glutamate racemase [Gammaproteobacteria bacterium]
MSGLVGRSHDPAPIGVFDSGVGGLTVLSALLSALPDERFVYLGDTARLPYGTKSAGTVRRYAVQAASILVTRGVKALVVACNTASAVALEALAQRYAPLPVFGVVAPGARAAAAVASRRVVVLATESTLAGGAYQRALLQLRPDVEVVGRACPLLVALAEEGRRDGPIVRAVLDDYLAGLDGVADPRRHKPSALTVLLGCTHFPVFGAAIRTHLAARGVSARIVDSAATTAAVVAEALDYGRIGPAGLAGVKPAAMEPAAMEPAADPDGIAGPQRVTLCATDGAARFRRVGAFFLGHAIDRVDLVDL